MAPSLLLTLTTATGEQTTPYRLSRQATTIGRHPENAATALAWVPPHPLAQQPFLTTLGQLTMVGRFLCNSLYLQ